jgi:hypothetical protein
MGEQMLNILENLKYEKPSIHDIAIKVKSDLHVHIDHKNMNKSNKLIQLKFHPVPDVIAKILVYPDTIQIHIACTNSPIIYDISGAVRLSSLLGSLFTMLQYWSNFRASIVPLSEWIVTHYHFGKDGTEEYSGQAFHVTFEDFTTGLIRYYSKKINGKMYPRIEQVQTPQTTMANEIKKMLDFSN